MNRSDKNVKNSVLATIVILAMGAGVMMLLEWQNFDVRQSVSTSQQKHNSSRAFVQELDVVNQVAIKTNNVTELDVHQMANKTNVTEIDVQQRTIHTNATTAPSPNELWDEATIID